MSTLGFTTNTTGLETDMTHCTFVSTVTNGTQYGCTLQGGHNPPHETSKRLTPAPKRAKHVHVVGEICPTCGTMTENHGYADREDW